MAFGGSCRRSQARSDLQCDQKRRRSRPEAKTVTTGESTPDARLASGGSILPEEGRHYVIGGFMSEVASSLRPTMQRQCGTRCDKICDFDGI